jgi:hypothetical protein
MRACRLRGWGGRVTKFVTVIVCDYLNDDFCVLVHDAVSVWTSSSEL